MRPADGTFVPAGHGTQARTARATGRRGWGRGAATLGAMRPDASFESLSTERLVLRRSRPEDAEAISAYRSIPEVGRYQGWARTDPEFIREEIEQMAGRAPGERGWVQLSVEERDGGRLVGDVGLSPAESEPGVVKVGYTMDPAAQGRGYATEAVRALVRYAFEVLDADVVRAYADAHNTPSIRVAEKAGLRLMERAERSAGGESWVVVRYEIDRGESDARGREQAERDAGAAAGS
jgi:RimJ/RimL family protein N-acetyltransferase